MDAFPTVYDLAAAKQHKVLKLWQGLGYYSRARNLHFTAKEIVDKYNGEFPDTYKELLKLKGVGSYTAAAIASICFNRPTAVVDGNVYRLLSRFFGVYTPIDSGEGKKEYSLLANKLIDKTHPATFNQAIMEFGAVICKPKLPDCGNCPLADNCFAFAKNEIARLPVKAKSITVKKRYFNYFIYRADDKQIVLRERTENDIWKGLFEFPLIESPDRMTKRSFLDQKDSLNRHFKQIKDVVLLNRRPVVHKLTHQHIYASFWMDTKLQEHIVSADFEPVKEKPVSVLISNFVKNLF